MFVRSTTRTQQVVQPAGRENLLSRQLTFYKRASIMRVCAACDKLYGDSEDRLAVRTIGDGQGKMEYIHSHRGSFHCMIQ